MSVAVFAPQALSPSTFVIVVKVGTQGHTEVKTIAFTYCISCGAFGAEHHSIGIGGRVALRYAEGSNFNGSRRRIAGISDATGLILGLMPHPERFTHWTQHPQWTRLHADVRAQDPPGLAMFRNAVRHASGVPA